MSEHAMYVFCVFSWENCVTGAVLRSILSGDTSELSVLCS